VLSAAEAFPSSIVPDSTPITMQARVLAALRAARGRVAGPRGVDPAMPDTVRRASVKVPLGIVTGEAYNDLAFVLAAKVGHLAANPTQPGCIADLTTIARYLGLTVREVPQADGRVILKAPSSLYAAQRQLTTGGELTVVRRTKPSGTGTSAIRRPRALDRGEAWVMVPVALLGAVPHRHARAYAVITYAAARGHHLTYAELANSLRHQSGRRIGEPVSVRAARAVVADLERWGWVGVGRREGWQGRNMLVPLRPFDPAAGDSAIESPAGFGAETEPEPDSAASTSSPSPSSASGSGVEVGAGDGDLLELPVAAGESTCDHGDGTGVGRGLPNALGTAVRVVRITSSQGQRTSGSQGFRTSLASKEDTPIDLRETANSRGGSARRASYPGKAAAPVENRPTGDANSPSRQAPSAEPRRSGPRGRQADGTISASAAAAFASITPLVTRMSPAQRVSAAGLIDRAIAEVGDARRVHVRLADRLRTQERPVKSPLGWLRGRGLPRRGCADPNCEDGRLWLPVAGLGAGVPGDPSACRNCVRWADDRRAAADACFGPERRAVNRPERNRGSGFSESPGHSSLSERNAPGWGPSVSPWNGVGDTLTSASEAQSRVVASKPLSRVPRPLPFGTCDGCERAVRGLAAGALCGDCREELARRSRSGEVLDGAGAPQEG